VDGDLLLLLTDSDLEQDIGVESSLMRKRFMRELEGLKVGQSLLQLFSPASSYAERDDR
jgi:SAM domain (Sterile alpha motif)